MEARKLSLASRNLFPLAPVITKGLVPGMLEIETAVIYKK